MLNETIQEALRVVVVDADPLARRQLQSLLKDIEGAQLVGQATGRADGLELIGKTQPHVAILDVAIRDGSGFELIKDLPVTVSPAIIFATAFEQYALQAFDVMAIDYLLKPVGRNRLEKALKRARRRLFVNDIDDLGPELRSTEAVHSRSASQAYQREIWVRHSVTQVRRIPVELIDYITAEVDYVRLHLGETSYLASETLANLERKLDPRYFIRIHRSAIIRVGAVSHLLRSKSGATEVHMNTGRGLRVGRFYSRELKRVISAK